MSVLVFLVCGVLFWWVGFLWVLLVLSVLRRIFGELPDDDGPVGLP